MAYVFKIGPLVMSTETPVNLYFVAGGEGGTVQDTDDVSALRRIAERERGAVLQVEPRLAEAGRALGFTPEPLSEDLMFTSAITALQLASLSLADIDDFLVLDALLLASKYFVDQAPWEGWQEKGLFVVEATGDIDHRFEALVLAGRTDPDRRGIVLYDEPGEMEKASDLFAAADWEGAAGMDAIFLNLKKGPPFALELIERAYHLPYVPTANRMKGKQKVALRPEEALLLGATLRASAEMAEPDETFSARAQVKVGDHEIRVVMKRRDG